MVPRGAAPGLGDHRRADRNRARISGPDRLPGIIAIIVCSRFAWFAIFIALGILSNSVVWAQSIDEFQRHTSTLIEEGRLLEALQLLEKGLREFPNSPELLLEQGSLLLRLGRVGAGAEALEKALLASPEDPRILSKTAESRLRQGRFDQALDLFRQARSKGAGGEAEHQLAFTHFAKGSDIEALAAARRSVEGDPLEPRYRRFLAFLLDLSGRHDEAYRQLLAAYRLDPDDASTLHRLSSNQWRRRKNLGQALEFAELAQESDPENPLYQRHLAALYESAGEPELAELWRQRAAELERAFLIYSRALRLKQQGRLQEASLSLEEVTSKHPEFVSGLTLLAQIYQQRGMQQEALEAYLALLDRRPDAHLPREEGAWIHFQQGSLDLALELLQRGGENDLQRGLLLGYQLMLKKRWSEALQVFSRLQERSPLSIDLIQLMSFCLSELGRPREAYQLLAKAERLQPGDEQLDRYRQRLRFEEALRLEQARDWLGAAQILGELALQDTGNADLWFHLAYSQQQRGELAEAIGHYRRGLRLAPDQQWARQNLASCLYRSQRYAEAARQWERVAATQASSEALFQLGLCYSHLGRDLEAEAVFEKAVAIEPTPERLYNLGIARLRLLKVEDAWKLLREAAKRGYPPAAQLVEKRAQR